MSEWRHVRSIGVEHPHKAYFAGYDEPPLVDFEVRIY